MMISELGLNQGRLAEICQRHHVAKLEVFGSFARGDARPESDLDLLITYESDCQPGLSFVALQQELETLTGRRVDLLSRKAIENSPNIYLKRFALRQTESLYVRA